MEIGVGVDADDTASFDGLSYYRFDGTIQTTQIESDYAAATDLTIDCGTEKTVVLSQSVWEDLQFPISQGKTPASDNPTWTTLTTNTGEWGFSVDEYIDLASNELVHSWKEGTDGHFHVHFTIPDANATGSDRFVKFTVYVAYINSSSIWTETSLTAEKTIPNGSSANEAFYLDMGDVSFSGLTIGTQVKCRVKRIAATGGTEYGSDALINQVGCHLELIRMGSRTEAAA